MADTDQGIKGLVDRAEDVAGGLIGRAAAAMTTGADRFVEEAAISDRYEIEAGALALGRASAPDVRAAAQMMIDDHGRNSEALQALLARRGGPTPPMVLDARRQSLLHHLRDAAANAFDAIYVEQQVMAHQEALTLMRGYRDRGDDEGLRRFAAEAAPMIERHLDHMKGLRARI